MREIRMLRTTWRKLETGLRDGLRHRKMAKASGQLRLPDPVATAPAFDPTGERRLETEPQRGVRHRHCESCREQLPPSAYRHRASRRLYSITTQRPHSTNSRSNNCGGLRPINGFGVRWEAEPISWMRWNATVNCSTYAVVLWGVAMATAANMVEVLILDYCGRNGIKIARGGI